MKSFPRYAEFFCGGGMVRAALEKAWDCGLANDIDPMKCDVYAANWGRDVLIEGDVAHLPDTTLEQPFDMYWASSPCQDFSLAGKGLGLAGARSGVFSIWVDVISKAVEAGHAPKIIAFENVVGLITRNGGADFSTVVRTLSGLGYRVGALEIDASLFVPQSRSRLFVVCIRNDLAMRQMVTPNPAGQFHTRKIKTFVHNATPDIQSNWAWWKHDDVTLHGAALSDVIDPAPDTSWLSKASIKTLMGMMSPASLAKMKAAQAAKGVQIGMLYKRGRPDDDGLVRQRAEVRFDGIAGCLRTPGGGSSRQTVLFVDGKNIRGRLLSSLEVARLMGLADSYTMPDRYNNAYRVAGDGVVVPVVQYLDAQLFQPALQLDFQKEVA